MQHKIVDWVDGQKIVRDMTPDEILALELSRQPDPEEIRKQRNALLVQSDWTQVADAPVDRTAWAVYRQELRDLTKQENFPTEFIWPTKPE